MITYADRRQRYTKLPTAEELSAIPLVHVAEFELSEKETRQLRAHLYAVNKDGIRRYRTLREFNLVLVWRIK
jgi:hypothetical protein